MPSEDIEKFRIMESRRNYEAADEWLRNFSQATWDEVRTFVTFYLPPGDEMVALLADVRDWEARNMKPVEVMDTPSGRLEDDLRVGMAQFRGSLDYLSLVGSTVRPSGYTESLNWSMVNPDWFLKPFTEHRASGGFLTITGRPRMGKTGVGCKYAEMWIDRFRGTEVLTNVPLEGSPPDGFRPVSEMRGVLAGIRDALRAGRRWLWMYDEPALSGWMKADAGTNRAKNLERFMRVVPKLDGSFIYIEQRVEGVPTTISDFAQSHIHCTNPGNVFADLPGKRMPIRNVPKPDVKYRTGEAGFFEIVPDFPWDDLFRVLRFNPAMNTIEQAEAATQAERIDRFLKRLDEIERVKTVRPLVTCRFCGSTWMPKSDVPPARCPRCDRRDPVAPREPVDQPRGADAPDASARLDASEPN